MNGTGPLGGLFVPRRHASLITACPSIRLGAYFESDEGIRGNGGRVGRSRSSCWSRVDPPGRSVTVTPVLLDLFRLNPFNGLSVLWLTSSANAHTVDGAFQRTMAIFGIVPHRVLRREESPKAF